MREKVAGKMGNQGSAFLQVESGLSNSVTFLFFLSVAKILL